MAAQKITWTFPLQGPFFVRIERYFLALLGAIVFIFSYFQFENKIFTALLLTMLFLGVYALISFLIMTLHKVEEKYHLTATHLEIYRTNKKKQRIALKDITHKKIDHFFRGAYIITRKGKKHPIFFNSKEESQKFERWVSKRMKKK